MAQFVVMLQIGYAQLRGEPIMNARLRSALHDWVDEAMTARGFERTRKKEGTAETNRYAEKSGMEELTPPRGGMVEGATAFATYRYEAGDLLSIDEVMALAVEATARLPFRVAIAITDGCHETRIRFV